MDGAAPDDFLPHAPRARTAATIIAALHCVTGGIRDVSIAEIVLASVAERSPIALAHVGDASSIDAIDLGLGQLLANVHGIDYVRDAATRGARA